MPRFSVYQLGRGSEPVIVVGRMMSLVARYMAGVSRGVLAYRCRILRRRARDETGGGFGAHAWHEARSTAHLRWAGFGMAKLSAIVGIMDKKTDGYIIKPDPADPRLTERVTGIDQTGATIDTSVTVERALTIFLNSQEIVTAMTIGDYPEYLAIGYLLNQNMLLPDDVVTGVDYDEELAVVVVRTKRKTNYEKKLKKKVQTSGCAQGTVFGDLMEALENVSLPKAELRTSWLYALTHKINTTPSLYLEAGAIHGCVLAQRGPAAGLHGRRRPPQRGRQDRRLDVQGKGHGRRQDFLHHRAAHLGDGDQDRAHGHSDPDLALGLHRLGRRAWRARPT